MGEAAKEFGAVFKDKSVCKVRPGCLYWNSGMGTNGVCNKCQTLEKAVGIDPVRPSFRLTEELVENFQDDPKIHSLLEAMRGIAWKDKLIFIEFIMDRPVADIAHEYEVSRASVYVIAKKVKKQIRVNLGLEK